MKTSKNVFNDTLLKLISGNIYRYPACRGSVKTLNQRPFKRQGVSCMSLPIQKKKSMFILQTFKFSKSTIKTPERPRWRCCSGVFIDNFEHILHLFLVLLLMTLSMR